MVYNFCIQEIKAYNFALIKIEKGEKEMYKEALRPVWAEINLSNLDYNIKNIKAKIGDREMIGVIKADAYSQDGLQIFKENLESFSDYARLHIRKMEQRGQARNAKNYKLAVAHLERFLGTTQVTFAMMSSTVLNKWIGSLANTNRAKEMYPVCVRQIFRAALVELNRKALTLGKEYGV